MKSAIGLRSVFLLTLPMLLAACSIGRHQDSAPRGVVNVANIPDAVPRIEPLSEAGNPSSYSIFGRTYQVMNSSSGYAERGIASWYGTKFHGRTTSNGEVYSMYKMTAAHKTLPIPTYVEVTNLENGKSVIVRVNDRGPFHANRLIDLSYVAAKKLGITAKGTGLVEVRSIDPRTWQPGQKPAQPQRAALKVPASGNNTLYIQAGAFSSRYNAEQLQRQLNALMPNRAIKLAFADSDRLYRVRIGPLSNVEEADKIAELISDNGYPEPHVVIE